MTFIDDQKCCFHPFLSQAIISTGCHSLSTLTFESNFKLDRIEPGAFSECSLKTMYISSSVQVIGGLAFTVSGSLFSLISDEPV
jgi:hypothetical protein